MVTARRLLVLVSVLDRTLISARARWSRPKHWWLAGSARHAFVICSTIFGVQLLTAFPAAAQETRYVYDSLGRLINVVDSQGRVAVYVYDAVGNLIAVRRLDSSDSVAITFVSPAIGVVGTVVEIFGAGFTEMPAANQVAFNGIAAPVAEASLTRLVTQVPPGATSGPITVTTALGSATSPESFLIPTMAVLPTQATVVLEQTRQFAAAVTAIGDQRVTWSVNGLVGGSPAVGTIDPAGRYTAPVALPTPSSVVQINASSLSFPQLVAAASVAIVPPSSSVVALPSEIRVVRSVITNDGTSGNVTAAAPSFISVVRPVIGNPNTFGFNVTVAAPSYVSVIRSGVSPEGLPRNTTVAAPAVVFVLRPGVGGGEGLPLNSVVSVPSGITVIRTTLGQPGTASNVTVAQPHDVEVRRP